jgi:hypothetical protein
MNADRRDFDLGDADFPILIANEVTGEKFAQEVLPIGVHRRSSAVPKFPSPQDEVIRNSPATSPTITVHFLFRGI